MLQTIFLASARPPFLDKTKYVALKPRYQNCWSHRSGLHQTRPCGMMALRRQFWFLTFILCFLYYISYIFFLFLYCFYSISCDVAPNRVALLIPLYAEFTMTIKPFCILEYSHMSAKNKWVTVNEWVSEIFISNMYLFLVHKQTNQQKRSAYEKSQF